MSAYGQRYRDTNQLIIIITKCFFLYLMVRKIWTRSMLSRLQFQSLMYRGCWWVN